MDLGEISVRHGIHSFKYGTSEFLKEIFELVNPSTDDVFYDLGSGYGIVLFYGAEHYPEAQFKGIEILDERFDMSASLLEENGLKNIELFNEDMFDCDFSDGTIFYIYNPLYAEFYPKLLQRLCEVQKKHPITVIAESRCRVFDETDWLIKYDAISIDVVRQIHFYRSQSA
ncbi:MAG: class I SAM-dependent methyltransferase [Crocinitomicaceae bacterium]|nr:class I SAM-dependent methyltransferase [Crocinitomicaceae bacterium]